MTKRTPGLDDARVSLNLALAKLHESLAELDGPHIVSAHKLINNAIELVVQVRDSIDRKIK